MLFRLQLNSTTRPLVYPGQTGEAVELAREQPRISECECDCSDEPKSDERTSKPEVGTTTRRGCFGSLMLHNWHRNA